MQVAAKVEMLMVFKAKSQGELLIRSIIALRVFLIRSKSHDLKPVK